jgi:DNA-binding NarL/FixJ family response regulator
MKLILVDYHSQFRLVLKYFVEFKLNHRVIGEAKSGEEFIKLKNISEADIILMDLLMDNMNCFDVTKKILWDFPGLKIIAMTMINENILHQKLLETGFKGVILKTEIFRSLEMVLQSVYSDGFKCSHRMEYQVS